MSAVRLIGDGGGGPVHDGPSPHFDVCPECLSIANPPVVSIVERAELACDYVCSACGHLWSTGWALAYMYGGVHD